MRAGCKKQGTPIHAWPDLSFVCLYFAEAGTRATVLEMVAEAEDPKRESIRMVGGQSHVAMWKVYGAVASPKIPVADFLARD